MPLTVLEYQETPNPNALKCVLSAPAPALASPTPHAQAKLRSYTSPQLAANDPLAAALFAIPGIRNVLIHDAWLTIGKHPDHDWKSIKAQLTKVLSNAL